VGSWDISKPPTYAFIHRVTLVRHASCWGRGCDVWRICRAAMRGVDDGWRRRQDVRWPVTPTRVAHLTVKNFKKSKYEKGIGVTEGIGLAAVKDSMKDRKAWSGKKNISSY